MTVAIAYPLCPQYPEIPCSWAVIQQRPDSNLFKTFLLDGVDTAYVLTIVFYSGFDEVAKPESGKQAISYMNDPRNVGFTNSRVQDICPNKPAGEYVTHEGSLYKRLGYALVVDV